MLQQIQRLFACRLARPAVNPNRLHASLIRADAPNRPVVLKALTENVRRQR